MKTRKANTSDLDQLENLFDAYRIFYRKQSDIPAAKDFLLERLKNGDSEIFVVETDNQQLAGFTQLYPLFSSTKMKKMWLLNDLFVHPDYRGKGISVMLIDRAKQLVKDTSACAMFLETEKSNDIGNALYPRTGFILNDAANYYVWELGQ